MRFGSLFAGIGGMDLGLERAGMTCAWQVEIDPFARRVLAKHWPNVPRFEDVRTVGAAELAPVDLICGGFPCQDISRQGQRAGLEGERSGLWSEFARVVRELRPRLVLVENVADLLARGFGQVLGDLAGMGFDAEWTVLEAAAFGAPHRRARVFVLAYAAGFGREEGRRVLAGLVTANVREASIGVEFARGASGRVRPVPAGGVRGVDARLPGGLDRLRTLGNAVVPQVAEWIGTRIVETAQPRKERERG